MQDLTSFAFTYNGHREKMYLGMALVLADNPIGGGEPNLMSGNISNLIFGKRVTRSLEVERMRNGLAVDEGADLIMGETLLCRRSI